ncbi:MAG: hypothetical protein DI537_20320 [Stutzerimonas stutzeri]|nr:MAG: hypothetical protein DI537_20320 [Stutzerimonas stutzeri]
MAHGIKDIAVGRSDTYRIAPHDLHIKAGLNSRVVNFNPEDPDDHALAESIAAVGVKQPLTIFYEDGKAFVSDGHRRHGAMLYAIEHLGAEIKSVPAQMEERYASEADRVFSQIVRNSGKPLAPIEQAQVFKRLVDLGWSEADIAGKSGLNVAWVKELLKLHAAPTKLTKFVKEGKVSATLAMQTLKETKGDTDAAADLLGDAVESAEKEGKTKATAKHVKAAAPKKLSLREELQALLKAVETKEVRDGAATALVFSPEQYDRLRVLVGI